MQSVGLALHLKTVENQIKNFSDSPPCATERASRYPCTPYKDESLPVVVMAHLLYIRCVEYAYYSADLTWQECQTIIFQMVFANSGNNLDQSQCGFVGRTLDQCKNALVEVPDNTGKVIIKNQSYLAHFRHLQHSLLRRIAPLFIALLRRNRIARKSLTCQLQI